MCIKKKERKQETLSNGDHNTKTSLIIKRVEEETKAKFTVVYKATKQSRSANSVGSYVSDPSKKKTSELLWFFFFFGVLNIVWALLIQVSTNSLGLPHTPNTI